MTTKKRELKAIVPSRAARGSAASLPARKTWELLAEGEDGEGLKRDPLRLGGDVLMWFCGYSRSLKLFVAIPRAMAAALDNGKWSRLPYLDYLDEVIYPALHSCARRRGRAGWPSGDSYWGRVREPQNDQAQRHGEEKL